MVRRQRVNLENRLRWLGALAALALIGGCEGDIGEASMLGGQAQQQLDAGQFAAARQSITAAIQERDDLAALHLLRGRIEVATNRFGAAYDAYSAALALEPTNPEALQGVAQLGLRSGHAREADDAADRILSLEPDQPDALLVKGLVALLRSRPAEAIELADRILAVAPTNETGAILKARALFMRNEGPRALAFLNEFEAGKAETEGLARTRLELLREAGDAPGMLREFATVRRAQPKDWDLTLDEANLRYKTGDRAAAGALTRRALFELQPSVDQTAAVTALWREYDRDPLSPEERGRIAAGDADEVRVGVARFYLDTGRPVIALEVLKDARSPRSRALAARARIAAGEAAAGGAEAERILGDDGTQCDALLARSAARTLARDADQAVIAAQSAAAECPQDSAAPAALARAYDAKRDAAGARRAFVEGVGRNPQDPAISKAFGAWLEAQGKIEQAVAEARRLTRRSPALTSAWQAYLDICSRHSAAGCVAEARNGLDRSRRLLGVDLQPGASTSRSLFGRLPPR